MSRCRARAILASFVCAALGTGCGGSAPVTQVPAVESTPPPPPPTLDVSAIAAPAGLLVSGALAKPSASLARVKAWANIPLPQSEQATELLLGESAGPLVDLDQPIHFAAALGSSKGGGGPLGAIEGGVLFAVSAAVRNVDAARSALSEHFKLVPGPNGVFVVQGASAPAKPPGDGDDEDEEGPQDVHRACELAPSFGAAPYRLVCAYGNDKALGELGPWLTRGATRLPVSSDVHVDLRMQPLQSLLEGEGKTFVDLAIGFAASSLPLPSLRDLVSSIIHDAADFVLDLDGESLDLVLSDAAIRGTATLSVPRKVSTFARLLSAGADRDGPPPASFWRLPADASMAGFSRGIDDALLAHARGLVLKVVDEELAQDGVPPADRKALLDAAEKLAVASPASFALGLDADAAGKAVAALTPPPDPPGGSAEAPSPWTAAAGLLGWEIVDLGRPGDEVTGAVKALVAAWNRPALAAAYRTKTKGMVFPSLRAAAMPKGKTWPKDAVHYVFEVPAPKPAPPPKGAKPRPVPKALLVHALVVPDGDHTWLSVAGDEATAASRLAATSGGAGDALSGRADLAPLKTLDVGSAGFFTIRALFLEASLAAAVLGGTSRDVSEPLAELAQLPQHGATPWVFTSTATSGAAPSSLTISVEIPRGAIDDVTAFAIRHGGF